MFNHGDTDYYLIEQRLQLLRDEAELARLLQTSGARPPLRWRLGSLLNVSRTADRVSYLRLEWPHRRLPELARYTFTS